mmetsp:Transcript_10924/g.26399  ORF Transcript_10924/g.26399 Transcript_10924/m.26399 type:complete len:578 (+) Transcript_10924:168-1901(+)
MDLSTTPSALGFLPQHAPGLRPASGTAALLSPHRAAPRFATANRRSTIQCNAQHSSKARAVANSLATSIAQNPQVKQAAVALSIGVAIFLAVKQIASASRQRSAGALDSGSSAAALAAAAVASPEDTGNGAALEDAETEEAPLAPEDMTGHDIWKELQSNNIRYASGDGLPLVDSTTPAVREELAKGQAPPAIILSCADSRVPPEVIFQKSLGDLFVVRCAGNIISDYSALGSLEFGVAALGARLIVVLGHSKCGAIAAGVGNLASNGGGLPEVGTTAGLRSLVENVTETARELKSARPELSGDEEVEAAVAYNVHKTVRTLRGSPVLSKAIEKGDLVVVPAVYDLDSGLVNEVEDAMPSPPTTTNPHGLWNDLLKKNADYAAGVGIPVVTTSTPAVREELSGGQAPHTIVVSCADSRVPPEVIFQQTIGEIFVVRCAGNIISDYSALGSVEFGVSALGAKLIVVLGHSKCGAIAAGVGNLSSNGGALPAPGATAGLRELVESITVTAKELKQQKPSLEGDEQVATTVAYNAVKSANALRASPVLSKAIADGEVAVVSAVYDLDTGLVNAVDEAEFS